MEAGTRRDDTRQNLALKGVLTHSRILIVESSDTQILRQRVQMRQCRHQRLDLIFAGAALSHEFVAEAAKTTGVAELFLFRQNKPLLGKGFLFFFENPFLVDEGNQHYGLV